MSPPPGSMLFQSAGEASPTATTASQPALSNWPAEEPYYRFAVYYHKVIDRARSLFEQSGGVAEEGLAIFVRDRPNVERAFAWAAKVAPEADQAARLCSGYLNAAHELLRILGDTKTLASWHRMLNAAKLNPNIFEECSALMAVALDHVHHGRYGEAEPLHARALQLYETHAPDNPYIAYILTAQGDAYLYARRFRDAEKAKVRALEILERFFPGDGLDVGIAVNSLGEVYSKQGLYNKAEQHYRRALEIFCATLPQDHPRTGGTFHSLASLCNRLGRHQEAEERYCQALAIFGKLENTLPEGHAFLLSDLGSFYVARGRDDEAEQCFLKAVSIRQKYLLTDDPRLTAGKDRD